MSESICQYSYGEEALLKIPERPARSNKGTFGRLLVIGGCCGMSGAPFFSAYAAYRSGVGLVEIYSDEANRAVLQTLIPEAIVTCYSPESLNPGVLREAIKRSDAISVGMGLGRSEAARTILATVLQEARVPTVIDADALNLLSLDAELRRLMCGVGADVVITPHFGEMSRLCGIPIAEIADDPVTVAKNYADAQGVICLLKDRHTIVCEPESDRIYLNSSGCTGLATAGSGDVLAGVIGAMCAYGVAPAEAARLGAYVHGLAGEAASTGLSEYSVVARDIIDKLPEVFLRVEKLRKAENG